MSNEPSTAAKVKTILESQRAAHGEAGEPSDKVRSILAAQQSAPTDDDKSDLTTNAQSILAVQRGT